MSAWKHLVSENPMLIEVKRSTRRVFGGSGQNRSTHDSFPLQLLEARREQIRSYAGKALEQVLEALGAKK